MHVRVLVGTLGGALLTAACASDSARDRITESLGCAQAEICDFEGELRTYPGEPHWLYVLETQHGCLKLLLPEVEPANIEAMQNKLISVRGKYLQQLKMDPNTIWYVESGRPVVMGICDQGYVVFVSEMRFRGRTLDFSRSSD